MPDATPQHSKGAQPDKIFQDVREAHVAAPPEVAFEPIRRIGGTCGWYYQNWLWRVRGWIDRMVGGPGFARGRRSQDDMETGDVLDCWSVDAYVPDRLLRLRLDQKLPGEGRLEFEVIPNGRGSIIRQTATLVPDGFWGRVYWWVEYPFHSLIFPGMLRGIVAQVPTSRPACPAESPLDGSVDPVEPVAACAGDVLPQFAGGLEGGLSGED